MKINLDYQLVDADDSPIIENGFPVPTVKVLKRAILADEDKDKKLERFELFLKLKGADSNTDFTLEECSLLDKAIAVFPTLIYGQLSLLLNNKN